MTDAGTADLAEPAKPAIEPEANKVRPSVAVPPRPVTLPPRPASSPSINPHSAPSTRPLLNGARAELGNGNADIPQAPRTPGLTPPLPPVSSATATPRPPGVPPPLPIRRSVRPPGSDASEPSSSRMPVPPPSVPGTGASDVTARLLQLQSQLSQLKHSLAVKESELYAACTERDSLRSRVAELERTSVDLSSRLADSENGLSSAQKRVTELEQELSVAREEYSRERERSAEKRAANEDDLKQIRGIGPKFERALNAAGMRSLSQIAALTPEEIDALAKQINVSAERIRREDWVGRAQALLEARRSS
jgi:predicted flap endonuclease-1-like 5' DNA nuclease